MKAIDLLDSARSTDERRILHALLAFAAGDAFGVAYEYLPDRIPVDPHHLAARGDWPFGGVSDDTLLSLLTIFAVIDGEPEASGTRFLDDLRAALPRMRGLGPTTKAALGLDPEPGEGFALIGTPVIGNTNGAMMRTAVIGLGFPPERDAERRVMVTSLARATHPAPSALTCAVLCSALYSAAFDSLGRSAREVMARELAQLNVPPEVAGVIVRTVDRGPSPEGVSLDPIETLAAVISVVDQSTSQLEGYRLACELGGDTDTIAALAAGIIAVRASESAFEGVPWIDDVGWAEIPEVTEAAARLHEMRGL